MAYFIEKESAKAAPTERTQAFMEAVNRKAAELGMKESFFKTPSGQGIESHTTARELLKLVEAAAGAEVIRSIWGKKTHKFSVCGENAREIELITTVQQAELEEEYELLGGKTGMWTCDGYDQHNLVAVAKSKTSGKIFAGVILGADSADGRFSAMHELFSAADDAAEGKEPTKVTRAFSVIAAELDESFKIKGEPLYAKNADVIHIPASTAKVLSIVTALDYITELDGTVELEARDIQGGSGAKHFAGDKLTVREIFHSMLLPSSNTCAYALASLVGGIILEAN